LDEVQNLKNWESVVRSLLNRGYRVFVTGSSSKLLSKEIATQLRGRTLNYLLLPFSFKEFLKARKFKIKRYFSESEVSKIKKMLREYLHWGGFPEVVLKENKNRIVREYFELMFYKDFIDRHKIKSIETARVIYEYLIQNFANEISITKIQNFIQKTKGIKTKTTIYNYLDKISDTMVVFFLDRLESSVYKRKTYPKKIYLCDVSLSNILSLSENFGNRMENVVFLELLRNVNSNPLMNIYYLKTSQNREVEFVIKERDKIKQLINVTYANDFDSIRRNEWANLLHAKELFKKDNPELIIITWDYEDVKELSWFGKKGKIKFIPLWKWLIKT